MKLRNIIAGIFIFPAFTTFAQEGTIINTDNSELPSNTINIIHVDSSNVKWVGTNLGLSRFDDVNWITYDNTNATILNNNIKDIAYERTAYGTELWIATDSGLSVASYDLDGITGSTTYTTGNSGITGNNISNVGVDILHSRWIITDTCISLFKGSSWDTILVGEDNDKEEFLLSEVTAFTDIDFIIEDSITLVSTTNKGVLRYKLDGTTGASAYGTPWSSPFSDNINAIETDEPTQWYASAEGAFEHTSSFAKTGWEKHSIVSDLLSDNITAIHIDNNDNIWFGSDNGLAIFDGIDWFSYKEADGFVNNTVTGITSDMQNNVWVGTLGGIEWFSDIPGKENTGIYLTNQINNDEIQIFPNPAIDIFITDIIVNKAQKIRIEVYDLNGKLVDNPYNNYISEGRNSIPSIINTDMRNNPGTYIIKVIGDDFYSSEKLSVQ